MKAIFGIEMSKESIYNRCMYILFILSIYIPLCSEMCF